MNKTVKYAIFMIVVGVVVSLMLSIVNEFTSPIIESQKLEKVKNSLEEVDNINEWKSYSDVINISEDEFIEEVYISLNNNKQYQMIAYLINTKGYSNGNIESLVFIDYNKKEINSVKIISIENQTKGIGSLILDDPNYVKAFINIEIKKYFNDNVNNHNSESSDVISGATISSRGVIQAVISACNNFNNTLGENNETIK